MADLIVDKKNIEDFLLQIKHKKDKKMIIPDYQRPYAWNREKCETLWLDIVDAYENDPDEDYFLGTIVCCKNEENIEIIDGQQRITSLLLLLRAFYEKIKNEDNEKIRGLKNSIEGCIWKKDKMTDEIIGFNLESKVATVQEKSILEEIIQTGKSEDKKNKYSQNYNFFLEQSDNYAKSYPLSDKWKKLCIFVMDHCIILPIQCDKEETAFTIFQTLNDRGMPLTNADIFKAKIYQNLKEEDRDKFIEKWDILNEICKNAGISLDDIFRYYTHILRAKEHIKKKEIALRKFYTKDNNSKLKDVNLIKDLIELAKLWEYINITKIITNENKDGEEVTYTLVKETHKWLHCLKTYPNEYWKFAISVFFYYRKEAEDFDKLLGEFAKELIKFLFLKFIAKPTVSAIKNDIYNACINIKNNKSIFGEKRIKLEEDFENKLKNPPKRLVTSLLLLHAYLHEDQKDLIEEHSKKKLHTEHILPKKWQTANYLGWDKKDADDYLEHFGNKVICESKINIQAGNEYFKKKKEKYSKSEIANVKHLAEHKKDDWGIDEIKKRQEEVTKKLKNFFGDYLKEKETK